MIDKLITLLSRSAFNVFRPPSANVGDGLEDFSGSLVDQKGRGEVLIIHGLGHIHSSFPSMIPLACSSSSGAAGVRGSSSR